MKTKDGGNLLTTRTAIFSDCMDYRYSLRISWGKPDRYINWLMLNPSTADEMQNDPTIERCERRSRAMGFDGLIVTNLYALRATDPSVMLANPSPVAHACSNTNDVFIGAAGQCCDVIVCAWGGNARPGRVREVLDLLRMAGAGHKLQALRIGKNGQPAHPLYVAYETQPQPWAAEGDRVQ